MSRFGGAFLAELDMSLVAGLHHAEALGHDVATPARHAVADWAIRNVWGIVLGGGVVFWAAVAAVLVYA